MSTARAPELQPRRARVEPKRPDLRVVDDAPRHRHPSPGRVGTVTGILLFVALFALAGFQTVLINGQGHLDDLTKRIDAEQVRAKDLELALATLQSPARITTEARDRLGMIQPPGAVYLQPRADDDAKAADVTPETVPSPTTTVPPPKQTTPSTTPKTTTPSTTPKTTTPSTTPKTTTPSTTPKTTTPAGATR